MSIVQMLSILVAFAPLARAWRQAPLDIEAPLSQLQHLSKYAAFGADLDDWKAAVDRNRGLHSESLLEEEEEEHAAEGGAAGPKWPAPWAGKLNDGAKVVGKGAFGKVYVATLGCDGSKVAVKQMQATSREVDQEAGLLKAFSSYPNFVAYLDHQQGQEKGRKATHYIMMEAALGGDLTHIIDGRKRATTEQKYELFYGMLEGVAHMHDKNMVHRDLKPANVFVSRQCGGSAPCVAKVGDLGLSCQTHGAQVYASVPKCSGVAGTPLYIAPETYQSGTIDPKNDVWALGLMLYELTFRHLPARIENSRTMRDLENNVTRFSIQTDPEFNGLADGTVKRLIGGMLNLRLRDRLSSKEALGMASGLAGASNSAPAASLPPCFRTGVKPATPAKPVQGPTDEADEIESQGDVDFFTVRNVMTNVMAGFLFDVELVDPRTGVVIDRNGKLGYLQDKKYFPKSLQLGYKILEINDKPYAGLGPVDKARLKEGLFGKDLNVKYERA